MSSYHRAITRQRPLPLALLAYAAKHHRTITTGTPFALHDDGRNAEGERRTWLVLPGHLPGAFPSIPGALATSAGMEASCASR